MIAVTLVLVVGFGLAVVTQAAASMTPKAVTPSASAAVTTTTAPVKTASPVSPHPGELEIYDVYPGGATTEDPAVAYDTVSYEPIMNVFETLVAYNGSSSNGVGPNAFVPVLATCVPGTAQCTADYGSSLIVNQTNANNTVTGQYYTFVIDPAANFYDPSTTASWGVYPTDVMFSIAREMAYSEAIGVGNTPGWLVAQALLPNGSATFDGGIHAPYNTTPNDIYGSMLINDSNYCPSAAMTNAHGCITFNVSGSGGPWAFFLQLIGDGFMGTLSCGWYTFEGAGLPGWSGTGAANGDGSCALPDGGTSTQNSAWTTYLSTLDPTSWDAFEENLGATYPAPAPAVQWNMVGSGPYWSDVTPTSSPPGYSLVANPAYAQPSGCSGAGGLATYGGYCWPAAGAYIPDVAVYYESTDAAGIAQYKTGQADFAGFETIDIGEMLSLASEGKLNYFTAPTLSIFFQQPNFDYSLTAYKAAGLPGTPNIPDDFFSGAAARALLTHAVPYVTAEETANTVSGVVLFNEGGGPIAAGMNDYASNITYPYTLGNPTQPATAVGSAAWWWHVGTTIGSGYYDPELAACLNSTCVFPIIGENGATNLDIEIQEEINSIEAITGNHVQPYTYDLNFGGPNSLLSYQLGGEGPGNAPLPYWNLGWAADNFNPEDYLIPMAFPNSTYTYGDAVEEQLALPQYNQASCGHAAPTEANLIYWAGQPAIGSACQGTAYGVVEGLFYESTHTLDSSLDAVLYWGIQAVLNDLNLYTWDGQENQITSAAPWIEGSSINYNPTAGGGNDQFWFQIRYVPYETNVTFSQTGLSGSTSAWSVTAGSPATTKTNSTGGPISFEVPNGTLPFTITSTYGTVTSVTGPTGTTMTSVPISGSGSTAVAVTFEPTITLTFAETGLAANTPWSITLTQTGKGATGTGFQAGTGSTLVFSVPNGTSWKYVVSTAAGYKFSAKGSVKVKGPTTKDLKFTELFVAVTFSEKGLAKGTNWTVSLVGPGGATYTLSSTKSAIKFKLPYGSYSYTVTWSNSNYTTTSPTTGSFVITKKAITEKLVFTGPPKSAPITAAFVYGRASE